MTDNEYEEPGSSSAALSEGSQSFRGATSTPRKIAQRQKTLQDLERYEGTYNASPILEHQWHDYFKQHHARASEKNPKANTAEDLQQTEVFLPIPQDVLMADKGVLKKRKWESDLRSLSFSGHKFSETDVQRIVKRLVERSPAEIVSFFRCKFEDHAWERMRDHILDAARIQIKILDLSGTEAKDEDWRHIAEIVLLCGVKRLVLHGCNVTAVSLYRFNEGLKSRPNIKSKLNVIHLRENELHDEASAYELWMTLSARRAQVIHVDDITLKMSDEQGVTLYLTDAFEVIDASVLAKFIVVCQTKCLFMKASHDLLESRKYFAEYLRNGFFKLEQLVVESSMDDYDDIAKFVTALKVEELIIHESSSFDSDVKELKVRLIKKKHVLTRFGFFCGDLSKSACRDLAEIIAKCGVQRFEMAYGSLCEMKNAMIRIRRLKYKAPEITIFFGLKRLRNVSSDEIAGGSSDEEPVGRSLASSSSSSSDDETIFPRTFKTPWKIFHILEMLPFASQIILKHFPLVRDLWSELAQINQEHGNRYALRWSGQDIIVADAIIHGENMWKKSLVDDDSLKGVVDAMQLQTKNFQKISISHRPLTKDKLFDMTHLIGFCNFLSEVVLCECGLRGSDVEDLVHSLLRKNGKLKLLDVSYNPTMGETGAKAIAELLRIKPVGRLNAVGCKLHEWHDNVITPALLAMPLKESTNITYAEDKVDFTAGANGGTVDFATRRCLITFPPDAVKNPTRLSFKLKYPGKNENIPEGLVPVSAILECLPNGVSFDLPVTIRITTWVRPIVKEENNAKLNLRVLSRDNERSDWGIKMMLQQGTEGFAEFETSHFSDFNIVAEENEACRAEGNYCNMLFLSETNPPHHRHQTVSSWFVPNDPVAKDEAKADRRAGGMSLTPSGEVPLRIRVDDRISVSITQFEEPNMEAVTVRPANPVPYTGADILRDNSARVSFIVKLADRTESAHEKSADFWHMIKRNNGPDVQDPFVLTWVPREEMAARHIHNNYTTVNITHSAVNIISTPEEVVVQQQLLSSTVAPAQQVAPDEEHLAVDE